MLTLWTIFITKSFCGLAATLLAVFFVQSGASQGPLVEIAGASHDPLVEGVGVSHGPQVEIAEASHDPLAKGVGASHDPLVESAEASHGSLVVSALVEGGKSSPYRVSTKSIGVVEYSDSTVVLIMDVSRGEVGEVTSLMGSI